MLEAEYPLESLPTVEEAEKPVAAHRALLQKHQHDDHRHHRHAALLAELQQTQAMRRQGIEAERDLLEKRHALERAQQQATQRAARDGARTKFMGSLQAARLERYQNRPTGLAAFLGKISGINLVREKIHRHHDAVQSKHTSNPVLPLMI